MLVAANKNNARINRRNMMQFRQVVDELELRDLHGRF